MRTLLHIQNLTQRFFGPDQKPFAALDCIDCTIDRKHRHIMIVGPDGAGKSTLLQILMRLREPTKGTFRWHPRVQSFGYLAQGFALYEDLSVWENCQTFARLYGVPKAEQKTRIDNLLKLTGLAGFERRLAGRLSGGMKQKLGLIVSLLSSPDVVLLDEPTVGVDPLSSREFAQILARRRRTQNLTTIIATANLYEAEDADWVLFFHEGKLLRAGAPRALRNAIQNRTFYIETPTSETTKKLFRALIFEVLDSEEKESLLLDVRPDHAGIAILTKQETTRHAIARRARAHGIELHVRKRTVTMEDVYIIATDRNQAQQEELQAYAPQQHYTITAQNIERRFGSFVAVANTNFTVRPGEIFGLLGPNGAGKTTTFRMLCGLLEPTHGDILFDETSIRKAKAILRSQIGYVAQKFSLYDKLTVRQNFDYFANVYNVAPNEQKERIDTLIRLFHLRHYRKERCARLPMGAKRELSFAIALLHHPSILFLDRATSGADIRARRQFWRRIVTLAKAGVTIIVTTHFMDEAHYCDRFLIQDQGKILFLGTPNEIQKQVPTPNPSMTEAFISIVQKNRRSSAS